MIENHDAGAACGSATFHLVIDAYATVIAHQSVSVVGNFLYASALVFALEEGTLCMRSTHNAGAFGNYLFHVTVF